MPDLTLRPVQSDDDLTLLDTALRCLSEDLNDAHVADRVQLSRALRGTVPSAHGIIALQDGALRGAVLFSPVFSTVRGAPGLYVSDLWVHDRARGLGLGRRLLAAAADRAGHLWQADWMSLAVYHGSDAARRFYQRLDFRPDDGAAIMKLGPDGLQRLMRDAG